MTHGAPLDATPMRRVALRLHDVSIGFGDQPGLRDLSFDVGEAERLVIVGPSGAGKTTLLRAIAGLTPVTCGAVEIAGRDRTDLAPERRDAVYLHQTPLLFPHLDVFENVAFPLRVRRLPTSDVRARVASVLESVQLGAFAARRPHTLSGGQRHRVALARAIVARPAVLLLDEPLSSLDPSLRADVREAISSIARQYRPALVVVTHDLDDAALMGDRIGVLLGGRIAQVATPPELFAHPASFEIARLLGISNEVPGVVEDGRVFCSLLGTMPLISTALSGRATMVFRPDAIRVMPLADIAAQCSGHVVELRYRPQQTTVRVQVAELVVEVAVDAMSAPALGTAVGLAIDARRVSVFPDSEQRA